MTDLERVIATQLVLPVGDALPGLLRPNEMSLRFKAAFREAVGRERASRGDVVDETQVYPLVRRVEGFRDIAAGYAGAFKLVAEDAADVLLDELVEVRGEDKDGIPEGKLYVPDADGSYIKIGPKTANKHDIDPQQVIAVVATWLAAEWDNDPGKPAPEEAPETFAIAVATRVLTMVGAAKLQIGHAKTLIADLKAAGETELAEVAQTAIRTTRELKGPDIARVTPEQMKRARARARKAS